MRAYDELTKIFQKQSHLKHLESICLWDEAVMMPPGGGLARAEAMATLSAIQHESITHPRVGELLAQAEAQPLETTWQQVNLSWMKKIYQQANCLPVELVTQSKRAFVCCEQAWRKLRAENNWQDFAPLLEENIKLVRESAQIKGETFNISPYDSLLDDFSPGITQALIDPIFAQLETLLPDFIQQVLNVQPQPLTMSGQFPINQQVQIAIELMRAIGFDFNHGRLDISHHPFCGGVPQDVRITTRYNELEFITALMGVCHETGHAMYERGLPQEWLDQPVGKALGMALHESQSLLIEMQACRSREFMEFLALKIKAQFGDHLAFSAANLYQTYTTVKPGYIRVDADELCYPLHVILRYQIEVQLINGKISVNDLPEVWDSAMQKYFNLSTKDNYRNGVMQDVHWPAGLFGYFPAYTLGAIIAAQLFSAAQKEDKDIKKDLSVGDFSGLMKWLARQVHSKGSLLDIESLLIEATGKGLTIEDYIAHLHARYSY